MAAGWAAVVSVAVLEGTGEVVEVLGVGAGVGVVTAASVGSVFETAMCAAIGTLEVASE